MRRNAITSTYRKANGKIKKRINKNERKSLKSHLTTILVGWTLMLSPIKDHKENV